MELPEKVHEWMEEYLQRVGGTEEHAEIRGDDLLRKLQKKQLKDL